MIRGRQLRVFMIVAAAAGLLVVAAAGKQSIGPAPSTVSTTVAAASDLQFALDELIVAYEGAHPGHDVRATYGSSGNFFSQISNGAPFDLYFSADVDYPRRLEESGLVEPGSTRAYALGRLALWVPEGSVIDVATLGMDALRQPTVGRIAIANPEHAPYGRAAVAAMREAGLYDAVADRLVLGENVAQAAQFVQFGAADIGLVALSLVRAPTVPGGSFIEVPAELHPPIEQGAAVLSGAADRAAAGTFLEFVLSAEARPVLERYGFLLPGD